MKSDFDMTVGQEGRGWPRGGNMAKSNLGWQWESQCGHMGAHLCVPEPAADLQHPWA